MMPEDDLWGVWLGGLIVAVAIAVAVWSSTLVLAEHWALSPLRKLCLFFGLMPLTALTMFGVGAALLHLLFFWQERILVGPTWDEWLLATACLFAFVAPLLLRWFARWVVENPAPVESSSLPTDAPVKAPTESESPLAAVASNDSQRT
jgi:hypothetical protein